MTTADGKSDDEHEAADDVAAAPDGPAAELDADEGEPDMEAFAKDETSRADENRAHGYGYE